MSVRALLVLGALLAAGCERTSSPPVARAPATGEAPAVGAQSESARSGEAPPHAAPFDVGEIKSAAVLEGARGRPPADIDALAQALARLSQIAVAWQGRFTSIEINPLLVRPRGAGVAALDALILTTVA